MTITFTTHRASSLDSLSLPSVIGPYPGLGGGAIDWARQALRHPNLLDLNACCRCNDISLLPRKRTMLALADRSKRTSQATKPELLI